jgi:hypothetical protein
MNDMLLMIIIFGAFYIVLLGVTAYFFYKWWVFKTKTPAEEFWKARKKGKLLCIDLYESGKVDYKVSDESDVVSDDDSLTHLAPLSTFIDGKSKATVTLRYNTQTVNGQTLSPFFVYLTQKINGYLEQGINNIDSLNLATIETESDKSLNLSTQEKLSLNHIKSFLRYNNAKGNYATAQRIVSLMYKRGWKDTMKFIALLIGGAIAGVILLGGIYIIITKLSLPPTEVIVNMYNQTQSVATDLINATIVSV